MTETSYWHETLPAALKVASGFSGSFSMTRVLSQELTRGRLRRPIVVLLSSGGSRLEMVADGTVDLAWCVPAGSATWAFEGAGAYSRPLKNLRAVARFPQIDRLMIAVAPWCSIRHLSEIAERKVPLRIAIVGQNWEPDYCMFENAVFARYGFTTGDVESWGGSSWAISTRGDELDTELPSQGVDLVAGEASTQAIWATLAEVGFKFLGLDENVVEALVREEGMKAGRIPAAFLPGIGEPLITIDESDFLLVTRSDIDDDLTYELAHIVDTQRTRIEEGAVRVEYAYNRPLPIPELSLRSPLTGPLRGFWRSEIPLHAGAERYYREAGYLEVGQRHDRISGQAEVPI